MTGEQHIELRDSRISRDHNDVQPEDGATGDASINCDKAEYVGEEAMKKIVGKSYGEITKAKRQSLIFSNYYQCNKSK